MFAYLSGTWLMLMGGVFIGGIVLLFVLLIMRRRYRSGVGRFSANFGLSLWIVLLLVTFIELAFAFFYDTTDSFNMTNVSKRWFKMHIEPHQYPLKITDTEGVMYREHADIFPDSGPVEPHHICFLGDSFTMGHGVPNVNDRFSNQLSKSLDDKSPGKFLVTNLADAGKDLFWVSRLTELLLSNDYDIDTLVYVMCLNDIESFDSNFQSYYANLGKHDPQNIFFKETYFLNLVYFRARQFSLPQVQNYYGFVKDYYAGEPWQKMSYKLRQLKATCDAAGTELQVVVFPFLHNLGPDYPFPAAHETITKFCESVEIPVLDLEPVFRKYAGENLTVNPFDAHPNPAAHRIAADAIEQHLEAQLSAEPAETAGNSDSDGDAVGDSDDDAAEPAP